MTEDASLVHGSGLVIAADCLPDTQPATNGGRSLARWHVLYDPSHRFVSIMRGPDHVVAFVNRAHRGLFDSNAWLSRPIRAVFSHLAGQGVFQLLDEVYTTGQTRQGRSIPVRYQKAGAGEEITLYLDFVYAPMFDETGTIEGVFCDGTDVTDRVTEAATLLSTEEQLRLATEAADIGWWDVEDGHGRLFWPPRVKAMFGISADAAVSMDDFYAGLHPDDRPLVAATYAGAADPLRRALYDVEYRTIGKEDGILRWVAAKGRGVFDEAGRCKRVIGTAIDITERKLAQDARLARQREDAELREQFIAVLGHDLRNPLASVAAGTQLISRRPEKAAEIAGQMQRSIERMAALIDNVLDFARGRLGGGFITTRDDAQALQPVLMQVIEELRAVHPDRALQVDIDLKVPVACDRQRIGQLLSNLLGNAFTYGTPAEPIEVYARAQNGQFELSVTNAGTPIDPSAVERLFHPFVRGREQGNREGLGLGLYICSEIAKAHGGTLEVTSESTETRFTLRMPTRL